MSPSREASKVTEKEKRVLREFRKRIDPKDAGAHNNLAVVLYNKGLYGEAIDEFKQALRIDPGCGLAQENLKTIYRKLGSTNRGIEELTRVVQTDPEDIEAGFRLAEALSSAGRFEEAVGQYQQCLGFRTHHYQSWMGLGRAQKSIAKFEEAARAYREAASIRPDAAEAHMRAGEVAYHLGLLDQSIAEFQKALELDSTLAEAHFLLGFAYGEKGLQNIALEEQRQAIKLNPMYARAGVNLGKVLSDKGTGTEVGSEGIGPSLSHYDQGIGFRNKGLFEEALKEFEQVQGGGPEGASTLLLKGEVQLLLGRGQEAARSFRAYLDLKKAGNPAAVPSEPDIVQHPDGELEQAVQSYRQCLIEDQRSGLSSNNLGIALSSLGRKQETLETLEKVLAMEPGNPEARSLLEALEARPEETSLQVLPDEPSGKPGSTKVPEIRPDVGRLKRQEKIKIALESPVGDSTVPQGQKPVAEEGLQIVPWDHAASDHGAGSVPLKGQPVSVILPDIERPSINFVPGSATRDDWVISRPIEMDYPGESSAIATPHVPAGFRRENPADPLAETALIAKEKEAVETSSDDPGQAPPSSPLLHSDEERAAEIPALETESPFRGGFPAPEGASEKLKEPETTSPKGSLAGFMMNPSEVESMGSGAKTEFEEVGREPETLSNDLRRVLKEALAGLLAPEGVEGAMLVDSEGLVLAESTRPSVDAEETAALAARIYETALSSLGRIQLGQLDHGIIETTLGQIYFVALGNFLLVLSAREDAKMGLILMQIKRARERLRRVLG